VFRKDCSDDGDADLSDLACLLADYGCDTSPSCERVPRAFKRGGLIRAARPGEVAGLRRCRVELTKPGKFGTDSSLARILKRLTTCWPGVIARGGSGFGERREPRQGLPGSHEFEDSQ
jgi:hypothetical protein